MIAQPAANLPEVVSYSDEGDDLLDELADDTAFMSNIRERRMAELRAQVQELEEMKQREHGTYQEVMNEKEVMNVTTTSKICVVHFFHKEFRRCMIMDKHLTVGWAVLTR